MVLAMTAIAVSESTLPGVPENQENVAVLPFEIHGLTADEGASLAQTLREALTQSKRYNVMQVDTMMGIFAEAGIKNLESCNYSYCLADLGKVLGVQKVVHASLTRRGKLYSLRIRLLNVADATMTYDEKAEHSGEFEALLTEIVPAQARKLTETRFETETKWYVYAAAVLVGVGAIYWIYRSFSKDAGEEDSGTGPPSPQQ
ncbi:MAG: hypothetical protein AAB393_10250 [Bacteroidota bacterium]